MFKNLLQQANSIADILLLLIDEENKKFIESKRQTATNGSPLPPVTAPPAALGSLLTGTSVVPAVLDALAGDEPSTDMPVVLTLADTEKLWSQLLADTPVNIMAPMPENVTQTAATIASIESDTETDKEEGKEEKKPDEEGADRWRQAVLQFKERVLGLSSDKRNFLMDPPEESHFEDLDLNTDPHTCKQAQVLLQLDTALDTNRYALVPKQLKEKVFWRNYFYRISLIRYDIMADAQIAEIRDSIVALSAANSTANLASAAEEKPTSDKSSAKPVENSAPTKPVTKSAELSQDENLAVGSTEASQITGDKTPRAGGSPDKANKPSISSGNLANDSDWIKSLENDLAAATIATGTPNVAAAASVAALPEGITEDWEKELQKELGLQ